MIKDKLSRVLQVTFYHKSAMRELFKFSMCSVQPFHCSIFFLKSSLDLKYLDNVICCKDCCANIRFIFLSKWHFLDLRFGSVKSTLHTQNGIQRSLYSDQTEIYTWYKSKSLQYERKNPFMGINNQTKNLNKRRSCSLHKDWWV